MIRASAAVAACATLALATSCLAAGPAPRPQPRLDEEFAAAARDLVRRARDEGLAALADVVAGWQLPAETDRQFAFAIPSRLEPPLAIEGPAARSIWDDFVAARRARAAGL